MDEEIHIRYISLTASNVRGKIWPVLQEVSSGSLVEIGIVAVFFLDYIDDILAILNNLGRST